MKSDGNSPLLVELGWDSFFEKQIQNPDYVNFCPVRIISQEKYSFRVLGQWGELEGRLSGKMLHEIQGGGPLPKVGDWVLVTHPAHGNLAIIERVLLRKTQLSRLTAGGRGRESGGATEEQIVASNVDVVFVVGAMDSGRGINIRRIERYLTLVWSSGASPVIILNKADLSQDSQPVIAEVEAIAAGVPVLAISAIENQGMEQIKQYLSRGVTAAFIGQSGVGKSSIINNLLGKDQIRVAAVREDDSAGKHTTTRRELFLLPNGGAVIDTPGMREIQLWTEEDSLDDTFPDILELAAKCRFRDCTHTSEPGCAVQQAVVDGILETGRLSNYRKLQKELSYLELRRDGRLSLEQKEKQRKLSILQKNFNQHYR